MKSGANARGTSLVVNFSALRDGNSSTNQKKERASGSAHISSEEGKNRISELSSEILAALERGKQDWPTKDICKGEESYAKHTLVQNILG
jgi:hypothetical protein